MTKPKCEAGLGRRRAPLLEVASNEGLGLAGTVRTMWTRTAEEEWLIDLLGEWQHNGKKFSPEDVVREVISHLALTPLRRGIGGLPLLPTFEAALEDMESRSSTDGPAWLCSIPYQSPTL
jgi:hypothetical protein